MVGLWVLLAGCLLIADSSRGWSQTFLRNTHAPTHTGFSLQLEAVYGVARQGEAARFAAFRDLPNHRLLWHGSRLTNFVGILAEGLRIAPPTAPSTGYMFGAAPAARRGGWFARVFCV